MSSPTDVDVVRLRLDISYDGTDFSGWAIQPGRRTVAGVLGDALTTVLCHAPRLVVAGRTDAGVHATGQVAHLDVVIDRLRALTPRHLATPHRAVVPGDRRPDSSADPPDIEPAVQETSDRLSRFGDRPPNGSGDVPNLRDGTTPGAGLLEACTGLRRRLAGILPLDVRVRSALPAPEGFDARFSALSRSYAYRIGTADWGVEPADRRFVLALRRPLDAAAMARSAAALIGLHDFAAYCKPREGATTIRDLQRLAVREVGDEVVVDVTADAFCHTMVRSLVGALIAVGQHRGDPDAPATLLAAGNRTADIHVAPAHGLCLVAVDYPPEDQLGERTRTTMAVRVGPAGPRPGPIAADLG